MVLTLGGRGQSHKCMPQAHRADIALSEVTGPVMDRLARSSFPALLTGRVFRSQYRAYHDLRDWETAYTAA